MDINITLLPECQSVFLLNGSFLEGGSFVTQKDKVVFLTVLPLNATFLPYSVKLMGGVAQTNVSLALTCKLSASEYVLKLGKRHFVFDPMHKNLPDDTFVKFFYFVKGRHFNFARQMMSADLAAGLGEAELAAFFDEYQDVVKFKGSYYAVDGSGVGHRCAFSLVGDKIDDISIE